MWEQPVSAGIRILLTAGRKHVAQSNTEQSISPCSASLRLLSGSLLRSLGQGDLWADLLIDRWRVTSTHTETSLQVQGIVFLG
jgi:hypothetical protein